MNRATDNKKEKVSDLRKSYLIRFLESEYPTV